MHSDEVVGERSVVVRMAKPLTRKVSDVKFRHFLCLLFQRPFYLPKALVLEVHASLSSLPPLQRPLHAGST
jgi:hypothetical protein